MNVKSNKGVDQELVTRYLLRENGRIREVSGREWNRHQLKVAIKIIEEERK